MPQAEGGHQRPRPPKRARESSQSATFKTRGAKETNPSVKPQVRDIRRMGSAALDLCAAAAGRLDGFYELGLNEGDHAAGGLITEEAGDVLTALPGQPFAQPMAIAATPPGSEELTSLLGRLHEGKL